MRKRQGISEIFALIFDPKIPALFIFGAIALAVIGNGAYDLLLSFLGSTPREIMYIVIGTFIILVGTTLLLWAAIREKVNMRQPVSGLVVFVGPNRAYRELATDSLEKLAIQHFVNTEKLLWCGLLYTPESHQEHNNLRAWLSDKGILVESIVVEDRHDERICYQCTVQALSWAAKYLGDLPIAIDVSGATKVMMAGAIRAAIEKKASIQYMKVPPETRDLSQATPHQFEFVMNNEDLDQ